MLILSGQTALQSQIGALKKVERAIKSFIRKKSEDEVRFIYYDRPNRFRIGPLKRKSAKSIRNFIQKLEKRWGRIDCLLLLGGDRVIPFFRLKNPCDDSDKVVLSDSPYASRDDDFLIPERVCARIPDNHSSDFIIQQLEKSNIFKDAFGLSARVWKRASENVYQRIGKKQDLLLSPPITSDRFKSRWLKKKYALYFNLHGSKVSPNWYGQDGNHYPIALSPANIKDAAGVVASEACYGAYIVNKDESNSICLKFLTQQKVVGFCGSTTIAYGPVAPPSGEADLMVKYFFEYLNQGLSLGESFKNAKLDFARKALRRRGFLDDDDQKTLLQFVLYGNPTLRLKPKKGGKR